jgi:hypothetical protein
VGFGPTDRYETRARTAISDPQGGAVVGSTSVKEAFLAARHDGLVPRAAVSAAADELPLFADCPRPQRRNPLSEHLNVIAGTVVSRLQWAALGAALDLGGVLGQFRVLMPSTPSVYSQVVPRHFAYFRVL